MREYLVCYDYLRIYTGSYTAIIPAIAESQLFQLALLLREFK